MEPEPLDSPGAVAAVAAADPLLAEFIARAGPLAPRPGEGEPFAALARAIVYQQLAIGAAATIHRRLIEALDGQLTPKRVVEAPTELLRAAGLSGAKAVSLRDLAERSLDGRLPLAELPALDDELIVERLVQVRGIGRWTAEMFLIFELVRPDVWPVDDLGVRAGWRIIQRLDETPSPRGLRPEGDRFRPYRSLVARYCWQAVHLDRARPSAGGTAAR